MSANGPFDINNYSDVSELSRPIWLEIDPTNWLSCNLLQGAV
jgi:hypothetical protein